MRYNSKLIFFYCWIALFQAVDFNPANAQNRKPLKKTATKKLGIGHSGSVPTNTSIEFVDFSKSTITQIETEFEKSIELLKDTANLPDSIFNLAYRGDYSLSGFGISIAELEKARGKTENSERNLKLIVQLLNLEAKKANTFSQLNLLKTIRLGGLILEKNEYWKVLDFNQKEDWKAAADVRRMYDPVSKTILNGRPTNYLGVAVQIATLSYELGFEKDEKMVNELLEHCVLQLSNNNGWLNDGKDGDFRFDRYHFEYIRFVWEAAERMERNDIIKKLKPWCEQSDILWLSLMHPVSGSTFAYGRSLQNTWEDVWEYGAFMLKRKYRNIKEFGGILYDIHHSWNYYLKNEYDYIRHISRMLDNGRSCYSYVGPNRIWGYSVHAFGKMLGSINEIRDAGYSRLHFPFYYSHYKQGNNFFKLKNNYGIWVISSLNSRLVIPIVTGIGKPKNSDYQPIPFAEGISEPPVNLQTTHLLPGIYKNGKMYMPDLKLVSNPKRENTDSIQLKSSLWISKSDTLSEDLSPTLYVVYQYSKSEVNNQFSMKYSFDNLEKVNADSIVYSIWKSKWKGSPYESGSFTPTWNIQAPDFALKEFKHDLTKPEGKGAFTSLPKRTDLLLKSPKGNLNWTVKLNFP